MKSRDQLTLRAAELSRSAPNSWDNFVKSFEELVNEVGMDLVNHNDPASVLRMQGRAQLGASLLTLFVNAVRDADGIQKRVEKRGT